MSAWIDRPTFRFSPTCDFNGRESRDYTGRTAGMYLLLLASGCYSAEYGRHFCSSLGGLGVENDPVHLILQLLGTSAAHRFEQWPGVCTHVELVLNSRKV